MPDEENALPSPPFDDEHEQTLLENQPSTSTTAMPSHAEPPQEFNPALLCRAGQETVQEILERSREVFQLLQRLQPPNGTTSGAYASEDMRIKLNEELGVIKRVLFKRLRLIFEKCKGYKFEGIRYANIESLVPYLDNADKNNLMAKKYSEEYNAAIEMAKNLKWRLNLRSTQIEESLDILRRTIMEINTMLCIKEKVE